MKMTLRQSLRDTALPIFLALWMALTPAFAGSMMLLGVGGSHTAGTPPSYTYITTAFSTGSGSSISQAVALGSNPSCFVVVGATAQSAAPTISVTVGGVSLTQDAIKTGGSSTSAAIFSGALASCSGSQTVALTTNVSSFNYRSFSIWVITNNASSTVVQSGGYTVAAGTKTPTSPTISVTAGDLMFTQHYSGTGTPGTCSGSSVSPTNVRTISGSDSNADWLIASTNASFVTNCDGSNNNGGYPFATYH